MKGVPILFTSLGKKDIQLHHRQHQTNVYLSISPAVSLDDIYKCPVLHPEGTNQITPYKTPVFSPC